MGCAQRLVRHLLVLLVVPLLARQLAAGEESKPKLVELLITASEAEDPVPPNPLGPTRRNFHSRLLRIRQIAADPQVAAVQLVVEGTPSFAHCLDLLHELAALKAAGKKIVCYAEMLGRTDAMLATMADLLVVPPTGLLDLEALVAEVLYLKNLLDKIDARVEVLHIGEFKTAFENLSRDTMSAGQRVVIQDMLAEFYAQIVGTLAANRGLERAVVEALFESVLVDPAAAAAAGLIDAVGYEDEFEARVREMLGGEYEVVEHYGDQTKEDLEKAMANPFLAMGLLMQALSPPKRERPQSPYVGIVYCTGLITSGESASDLQGNVSSMGSDTIVEALRELGEDEHCEAVVLRVNSPGGSALASDMIWRAIQKVREAKPVVASMGSVAASGGYWISMGCDAILAQPSTITGSIGVVSLLPDLSRTLSDWGINVEVVAQGPHGDQLSLLRHGPTPVLREVLMRFMEEIYERFLTSVADGRRLPRETVESLAHGRVWTGRQAAENGLVDDLGSLQDAIDLACALGGLKAGETPLHELPQAPDFFEALEEVFGSGARVAAPWEDLVEQMGWGSLVSGLRALMVEPRAIHADRVLALMPLHVVVR